MYFSQQPHAHGNLVGSGRPAFRSDPPQISLKNAHLAVEQRGWGLFWCGSLARGWSFSTVCNSLVKYSSSWKEGPLSGQGPHIGSAPCSKSSKAQQRATGSAKPSCWLRPTGYLFTIPDNCVFLPTPAAGAEKMLLVVILSNWCISRKSFGSIPDHLSSEFLTKFPVQFHLPVLLNLIAQNIFFRVNLIHIKTVSLFW